MKRKWKTLLGVIALTIVGSAHAVLYAPTPIPPDCPAGKHWGWVRAGTWEPVNGLADGGIPGCVPDAPPVHPPLDTQNDPHPPADLFGACQAKLNGYITSHHYAILAPKFIDDGTTVAWQTNSQGRAYGWYYQMNLRGTPVEQRGDYVKVTVPQTFVLAGVSNQSRDAFGVGYLYCSINTGNGTTGGIREDWARGCYRSGNGMPGTEIGCGH
ncbi:hypothetical protein [Burkholderia cepacia]|uniref:hypothetical protein n=1 Tax=Burkholderia cepacia TaxID=292 RepID=UPI002ABDFFC4|nr:hypothetical protein [Burkholderia cepacia]